MRERPRVVIGVPLYNRAAYLSEALESLLAQSYRDFALVLLDDGSTDETPEIVRSYSLADPRIVSERNGTRLGMVQSWHKVFDLAERLCPDAEYFAWGSDHDLWDPRWLAAMIGELEKYPEVVLAYPWTRRVSETGATLKDPWVFETFGVTAASRRLWRACWDMRAGDMVYGLFRTGVLRRAGGFRPVLLPDRLLLSEAALYGQFKQIPEVLWHRRFYGIFSFTRQRTSFFLGRQPLQSRVPWWLTHAVVLAWRLGLRGRGRPAIGRLRGLGYALLSIPVNIARSWRGRWKALTQTLSHHPVGLWGQQARRKLARALKQLRRQGRKRVRRIRKGVRRASTKGAGGGKPGAQVGGPRTAWVPVDPVTE